MRALTCVSIPLLTACVVISSPIEEPSEVFLCGDVEAMLGTKGEDVRLFLPEGEVALATVGEDSFSGTLSGELVKFVRTEFGQRASLSVGETAYPVCERIS